jgi:nitrogen fixation protein NifB
MDGFEFVEERPAPERGSGVHRWQELIAVLKDCRAILVSGIGSTPRKVLESEGILPVETNEVITAGLQAVFKGYEQQGIALPTCCVPTIGSTLPVV